MSYSNQSIATYLFKGVKTNSRGDIKISPKNSSIYSMYPQSSRTRYNFDALLAILNKYKELIKPDNLTDNQTNYQKCITELDDIPIGIFINHDKALEYKNHYIINDLKEAAYVEDIYKKIQTVIDELYNSTVAKKAVKPTTTTTTAVVVEPVVDNTIRDILRESPPITAPVAAVPAAPIATPEPSATEINSADFDPTKWHITVAEFEATKPILEAEIKALEQTLVSKFDIVSSNRLKKRQRMLAAFPATLARLKANAVSKQNYYTDGLQSSYKSALSCLNVDFQISYFHVGGHTLLTSNFNKPDIIPHLARNPALFLKVSEIVKDCRKKVNRLRVNKAEKETWVLNLETAFTALKEEVTKSKYYVNIPEDN